MDRGHFSHAIADIKKLKQAVEITTDSAIVDFKDNIPVTVIKKVQITDRIVIDITVKNKSKMELNYKYGVEFGMSLLAGDAPNHYFEFTDDTDEIVPLSAANFASSGAVHAISKAVAYCECLNLKITMEPKESPAVWRYPIQTISQSEGGYERVYQSSIICPVWDLSLKAGEEWKTKIIFEFDTIG